jgi:lipoprotein-anchoring transpeptidase ErfK/SrfK
MSGTAGGEYYSVPDVPHAMYINGDIAIHGTYWHNMFGTGVRMSHGCINLPLDSASWLYGWAPAGTPVLVTY